MNEPATDGPDRPQGTDANDAAEARITPLPGEPGVPNLATAGGPKLSRKGLLALALLVLSLIAGSAISIQRFLGSGKSTSEADTTKAAERPSAAAAEPRRLDLSLAAPASAPSVRVPALVPSEEEKVEPIGVRRTGAAGSGGSVGKPMLPEDAPVMLLTSRAGSPGIIAAGASPPSGSLAQGSVPETASGDPLQVTARNLEGYQRQLQGMLDSLSRSTALATGQDSGAPAALSPSSPIGALPTPLPTPLPTSLPGPGLFGGQLQGSATARVSAGQLGNRSLTLPKGTAFTCALKTRVISAASGLVGCQVQRDVYGEDGRVLLVERGSHMDGEYRIVSVRPGTVRIPVLWTRIRTPHAVTVDIESPGTGQLGESGIDGHVDKRWGERIGAALLLSLIDDSVKLIIENQSNRHEPGDSNTVILPSTTSNTSKLAEKVLDSTISIPPLIYQNQGGIVGIYVARDVDFSTVYALQASVP